MFIGHIEINVETFDDSRQEDFLSLQRELGRAHLRQTQALLPGQIMHRLLFDHQIERLLNRIILVLQDLLE